MVSVLDMSKAYKYLGIWDSNDIKHERVKSSVTFMHKKRLRVLLRSVLNGRNLILRYTAGIVSWTQAELKSLESQGL